MRSFGLDQLHPDKFRAGLFKAGSAQKYEENADDILQHWIKKAKQEEAEEKERLELIRQDGRNFSVFQSIS